MCNAGLNACWDTATARRHWTEQWRHDEVGRRPLPNKTEFINFSESDLINDDSRCLSGVWSGTTLHRASVQLSKPSDATHSARPVGQPGCGRRLPQSGQLTIGEELLGYHNNNNDSGDDWENCVLHAVFQHHNKSLPIVYSVSYKKLGYAEKHRVSSTFCFSMAKWQFKVIQGNLFRGY